MAGKNAYKKEPQKGWFKQNHFFIHYIFKELTCIPVILYSINLFFGLAALATTLEKWESWLDCQRSPIMVLLTIITLVTAIYHSYTWFEVTPKVMKIPKGEKFVDSKLIVIGHWAVFGFCAVVMLILYFVVAN